MEDENGVYEGPQATTYGYDQLNRLVSSIAYTSGNTMRTGNDWLGLYETDAYKTSYSYDANGNIMKLTRKDNNGQAMDNFTYNYKSTNNQLLSVSDDVDNAAKKLGDIQPGQSAENYKYDGIGNLIEDKQEEIKNIAWQANGKVKSVTRTPLSTKPDLEFKYDALGQRVAKIVKPKNDNGELLPESEWETTWYVRDAQGNEMAIYKQNYQTVGTNVYKEQLKVDEFSIYGSSRLGTESPVDNLLTERQFFSSIDNNTKRFNNIQTQSIQQLTFNANNFAHYRGKKQYHLSNHLGNVLATVSDRIIPESTDGLTVSDFKAEVVSASDYYPFGMLMPKRNHKPINIDFGFNGMRKENEWTEGNYDFGARIYDSRSGRWFAVDPLAVKYPGLSGYNFSANSPINYKDPDGKVVVAVNKEAKQALNTFFTVQFGDNTPLTQLFNFYTRELSSFGDPGNGSLWDEQGTVMNSGSVLISDRQLRNALESTRKQLGLEKNSKEYEDLKSRAEAYLATYNSEEIVLVIGQNVEVKYNNEVNKMEKPKETENLNSRGNNKAVDDFLTTGKFVSASRNGTRFSFSGKIASGTNLYTQGLAKYNHSSGDYTTTIQNNKLMNRPTISKVLLIENMYTKEGQAVGTDSGFFRGTKTSVTDNNQKRNIDKELRTVE